MPERPDTFREETELLWYSETVVERIVQISALSWKAGSDGPVWPDREETHVRDLCRSYPLVELGKVFFERDWFCVHSYWWEVQCSIQILTNYKKILKKMYHKAPHNPTFYLKQSKTSWLWQLQIYSFTYNTFYCSEWQVIPWILQIMKILNMGNSSTMTAIF